MPALIRVIVAPLTPPEVHTAAVLVLKVTVNPDEAVALMVTGDCAKVLFSSGPKVIVWDTFDTRKLRVTVLAALKTLLPGWLAFR